MLGCPPAIELAIDGSITHSGRTASTKLPRATVREKGTPPAQGGYTRDRMTPTWVTTGADVVRIPG